MDRVVVELENVRSSPDANAVHDLRVAITALPFPRSRNERSGSRPRLAGNAQIARKLFHSLGALRDAQVMQDWVKRLAPETDPVRAHLQATFESRIAGLREGGARAAGKFDEKAWRRLERALRAAFTVRAGREVLRRNVWRWNDRKRP